MRSLPPAFLHECKLSSGYEGCVCCPQELEDAPFYSDEGEEESEGDSEEDEEDEEEEEKKKKKKRSKKKSYVMDSDHRLLLRNSKPLLQSRSAAVSEDVGASSG